MEDNQNLTEKTEHQDEQPHVPKNTKQQTVLYTVISIALFCLLYFGGNGIVDVINRPYVMYRNIENTSGELLDMQYEYAFISKESEAEYNYSLFEKNESGYKVSILFSEIEDAELFAENSIAFEFANPIEDVENEFYPYYDNNTLDEHVTAVKYVDTDNPNNEILIFEYDGKIYAEFQSYGAIIPTEVKILFDGCEKVH